MPRRLPVAKSRVPRRGRGRRRAQRMGPRVRERRRGRRQVEARRDGRRGPRPRRTRRGRARDDRRRRVFVAPRHSLAARRRRGAFGGRARSRRPPRVPKRAERLALRGRGGASAPRLGRRAARRVRESRGRARALRRRAGLVRRVLRRTGLVAPGRGGAPAARARRRRPRAAVRAPVRRGFVGRVSSLGDRGRGAGLRGRRLAA
mmetsp:Transcript_21638/g.66520  ORF Transcript_21638/g.66520 Transcript_21638/m.66520 type:complete len:204 (-) Transcript_21638:467-1078(-)